MENKFLITFEASQEVNGEKDSMTFTAPGEYFEEKGIRIVKYKEYSEESKTKDDYSLNTIKIINDSKISILRESEHTTRLFLEKDKLHQCHYRTPMGDLMFGVLCTTMDNKLNSEGGKLDVEYRLNLNGQPMSNNKFVLTVKENRQRN